MFDVGHYQYRCTDYSLLDPYLRRFFASPLHRFIPIQIPANIISIVGHCCVWIVLILAMQSSSQTACWVGLLCLQLYLLLDMLDGMQARLTKTSSPLGEYIDHGGDAFNCGFIIYASLHFLSVQQSWFILTMIALGTTIFSLVSLEKKTTGSCVFPKIGNVELQCFLFVLLAMMQIPTISHLLTRTYGEFSLATWLLFGMAVIGGGLSIKTSLQRILYWPKQYVCFIGLSSILLTVLIWQAVPCGLATFLLISFMATYNCELLFSHLSQQPIPWPDYISAILIVFLAVMSLSHWSWQYRFYDIFLIYLIMRTSFVLVNTFRYFRPFWIWINPLHDIIG